MTQRDELFYDVVANEIRTGIWIPSLQARAISDALGDEGKAKALYIRYRVAQLKQEFAQSSKRQREAERRAEKEEKEAARREINLQDDPRQEPEGRPEADPLGVWASRILVALGAVFAAYIAISISQGKLPW